MPAGGHGDYGRRKKRVRPAFRGHERRGRRHLPPMRTLPIEPTLREFRKVALPDFLWLLTMRQERPLSQGHARQHRRSISGSKPSAAWPEVLMRVVGVGRVERNRRRVERNRRAQGRTQLSSYSQILRRFRTGRRRPPMRACRSTQGFAETRTAIAEGRTSAQCPRRRRRRSVGAPPFPSANVSLRCPRLRCPPEGTVTTDDGRSEYDRPSEAMSAEAGGTCPRCAPCRSSPLSASFGRSLYLTSCGC